MGHLTTIQNRGRPAMRRAAAGSWVLVQQEPPWLPRSSSCTKTRPLSPDMFTPAPTEKSGVDQITTTNAGASAEDGATAGEGSRFLPPLHVLPHTASPSDAQHWNTESSSMGAADVRSALVAMGIDDLFWRGGASGNNPGAFDPRHSTLGRPRVRRRKKQEALIRSRFIETRASVFQAPSTATDQKHPHAKGSSQ